MNDATTNNKHYEDSDATDTDDSYEFISSSLAAGGSVDGKEQDDGKGCVDDNGFAVLGLIGRGGAASANREEKAAGGSGETARAAKAAAIKENPNNNSKNEEEVQQEEAVAGAAASAVVDMVPSNIKMVKGPEEATDTASAVLVESSKQQDSGDAASLTSSFAGKLMKLNIGSTETANGGEAGNVSGDDNHSNSPSSSSWSQVSSRLGVRSLPPGGGGTSTSSTSCQERDGDDDNSSLASSSYSFATNRSTISGFDDLSLGGTGAGRNDTGDGSCASSSTAFHRQCGRCTYLNDVSTASTIGICTACDYALRANPCTDTDEQISLNLLRKEEQVEERKRKLLIHGPLLVRSQLLVNDITELVRTVCNNNRPTQQVSKGFNIIPDSSLVVLASRFIDEADVAGVPLTGARRCSDGGCSKVSLMYYFSQKLDRKMTQIRQDGLRPGAIISANMDAAYAHLSRDPTSCHFGRLLPIPEDTDKEDEEEDKLFGWIVAVVKGRGISDSKSVKISSGFADIATLYRSGVALPLVYFPESLKDSDVIRQLLNGFSQIFSNFFQLDDEFLQEQKVIEAVMASDVAAQSPYAKKPRVIEEEYTVNKSPEYISLSSHQQNPHNHPALMSIAARQQQLAAASAAIQQQQHRLNEQQQLLSSSGGGMGPMGMGPMGGMGSGFGPMGMGNMGGMGGGFPGAAAAAGFPGGAADPLGSSMRGYASADPMNISMRGYASDPMNVSMRGLAAAASASAPMHQMMGAGPMITQNINTSDVVLNDGNRDEAALAKRPGNHLFNSVVREHRYAYWQAASNEKLIVAKRVMDEMLEDNPTSCFWVPNEDGSYRAATFEDTLRAICKSLDDGKSKALRAMQKGRTRQLDMDGHVEPSTNPRTAMQTGDKIKEPHDNDVLLGRGKFASEHPGNILFRQIVWEMKEEYYKSRKSKKTKMVQCVIDRIKTLNPPGRFLKKGEDLLFRDAPQDRVILKVCQALRERR